MIDKAEDNVGFSAPVQKVELQKVEWQKVERSWS